MIYYTIILFILLLLVYFNFTNNDIDKSKIIEVYLKKINSIVDKSIIDESLVILLTIYKAELTRDTSKRWIHISEFQNIDNRYKIIPKLIKLGYITNINSDDKGSPLLIINYDGISIIELNNLLIFYTKKIKPLFIIKFLLAIKLNKNTGFLTDIKEISDIINLQK